jgi:putative spermidine/putrescine transport system substrate-binding protein
VAHARRKASTLVVAAGLVAALGACGTSHDSGGSASGKTLAVTMWGGSAQKAHVDSYVTPFAAENGVTVRQDSPTDYAKLTAQVQAKKVSWGITEIEPNFANNACADGRLTKLPDDVKAAATAAGVDPGFMGDCAIPNLQYSFTIAYNTKKFATSHPTTWAEFFDTKRFPGKRGFWKYATGGIFEAALLADGVPAEKLYPLDIDRAFKKLNTIKKDIVFYDTGDEQAQLVASGEAPLVQAWNGRIYDAAKAGQPVANEWNQNLISYDQVGIPAGYPNTALAQKWMTWFLGNPKAQAADADASAYAPVSPKAMEFVKPEVAKELTTFPANKAKSAGVIDYGYWAKNYDKVTERLNAWIAS